MRSKYLHTFRIFQLLYAIFLVSLIIKDLWLGTYDKNAFADLFINYQGGFVRRGLLGEFFLQCYRVGLNPITVALVLSFLAFFVISGYLIRQFVKRKYELSLLLVCFLLGGFGVYGFGGFRRDFMMLCLFLLCVTIWRKCSNKWLVYGGGNLLVVFSLLLYEPFVFWGVPLLFLLSLVHFKFGKAILVWTPSLAVFLMCCSYSGGEEVCQAIWNSVSGFLDQPGIITFLRKSTSEAVHFHLTTNFGYYHHVPTILVSLVSISAMIYYFVNGIYAFSPTGENNSQRRALLLVISFVLLCQLPMFTVLSTDYSRTCIVSAISSLIFCFSVDAHQMKRIFHPRLIKAADKVICKVDTVLAPSPYAIIFILLFIGVTSFTGSNEGCLGTSELGEIGRVLLRNFK